MHTSLDPLAPPPSTQSARRRVRQCLTLVAALVVLGGLARLLTNDEVVEVVSFANDSK